MKTRLFLAVVMLVASASFTAKSTDFGVHIGGDTVRIKAGEKATIIVALTVPDNFDATIMMSVVAPTLNVDSKQRAKLSATSVNYPYKSLTLTVEVEAITLRPGIHQCIVRGNAGGSFEDVIYIDADVVSPLRVWKTSSSKYPYNITDDNLGKYYYSRFDNGNGIYNGLYSFNASDKEVDWLRTSTNPGYPLYNDYRNTEKFYSVFMFDSQKNLWITGPLGLGKLQADRVGKTNNNGYFTIYQTENSEIPDNWVTALAIDATDRKWVGTDKGLAMLEGYTWTIFNETNSPLKAERITAIIQDKSGVIWVGTMRGLARYENGTWTFLNPRENGMPDSWIWGLTSDSKGNLYMGLGNSAYVPNWTSYHGQGRDVDFMLMNAPYHMYGMAKYDGQAWTLYDSTNSPMKLNYVNDLCCDSKGNVYVAQAPFDMYLKKYSTSALLKFNGSTWSEYDLTPFRSESNVTWVKCDSKDNIWLGGTSDRFWGYLNNSGLPFSAPLGVEEELPRYTDGIAIYPNPTNTSFTISGADNILSVKMMNSLGMEISRQSSVVSGKVEVDVADLASGVYFVQLRTPTGMITKSIIVSR